MPQRFLSVLLSTSAVVYVGLSACTQNSTPPAPSIPTALPTLPNVTPEQPNLRFQVERQSGNCPTSVGVWEILLPLEEGADHIVVADIRPARTAASTARSVTYVAPLADEYGSCVGQAIAPELAAYRFEFRKGQVYFQINPSAQVVTTIVSAQLASGRPDVFWRAEEGP